MILYPQSGVIPPSPIPRVPPPSLWSPLSPPLYPNPPQNPAPAPGEETLQSSAFLTASLSLQHRGPYAEGVRPLKRLNLWQISQKTACEVQKKICDNGYRGYNLLLWQGGSPGGEAALFIRYETLFSACRSCHNKP
ncbi:hypothetical protein PoB_006409000 [Plakobranchus ocellatus]|uniref:Uncharacterized protein n=1 Tax=Plakobranchus ocellatus TaxID=259542 RepID=A0AAV4D0D8_9GAST|nr:hypothetical protein PoB_006409000 [Plakobranchus ocellatus]